MLRTKLRAVTLALALGAAAVGCGQDTSDEAFLARAQAFVTEGEIKAAEIELKNALQVNPKNYGARKALGELYFENGNLLAAEKELLRVYESDQADQFDDLRPLLARTQLGMNRFSDIADIPLDNLEGENLATLLGAQALAYLTEGDLPKAKQRIAQALAEAPDMPYALYASAKVQAMDNEFDAALILLERVLELEPNFVPALSFKADIYRATNRPEEAVEFYSKALKLNKNLAEDRFKRAVNYIRLNDLDAAQRDVEYLTKFAPQNPTVNYAQGLVHFYNKKYEDAVGALVVAESEKFRYPDVMLYLALSHLRLGNMDRALAYAGDFNAAAPKHSMGNKLYASLLLNRGKPAETEKLMKRLLERNPNDVGALNLMANALVAQQRTDEALDYLNRVVEIDPSSEVAQVRLSAGLATAGKTNEAIAQAEAAIEMNPQFALADMIKVLAQIRAGNLDEALAGAEEFRRKKPVEAGPQLLLGRVYLARGERKKAIEAYNKAAQLEPGSPAANNALAAMAVQEGDYDKAREYYNDVLANHPDSLQATLALAGIEAYLGNEKAMLDYIEKANIAHPKAPQPKLLLAQYLLEKKRPAQALTKLSTLTEEENNSPLTLRLRARLQLALGNPRDAHSLLVQLLEQIPNSGQDHALIAKAYLALGDDEKQREHLAKAVKFSPNQPNVRYEMALRALQDGDSALLSEQLKVLDKIAPEVDAVRQLHAAQALLKGDPEKALALLQELHKSNPNSMSVLNVARQQRSMGRAAVSINTLQQWLKKHEDDVPVRLSLAESYLRGGRDKAAVEEYQKVLKYNGENIVALNNLAWFLREDNPEQALEYALTATDLVKNSPPLMDTLALVQAENRQYDQALVTIREALRLNPGIPAMEFHYAQIQAMKGDSKDAAITLRRILRKYEKFPEREAAQQLLDSLPKL
ncbi:MAG: PEP-CTERM system TPR-repeat protein PrsT [Gammaproteobacteria bacterium]|nr:MAG: PEP-CTERM system TPR-repeat protein PrsT [Gammaproteobacteria bacterium]